MGKKLKQFSDTTSRGDRSLQETETVFEEAPDDVLEQESSDYGDLEDYTEIFGEMEDLTEGH